MDSHKLNEATQKMLAKLLSIAPQKKKNYILDQVNTSEYSLFLIDY